MEIIDNKYQQYIELILLWEGEISTTSIMEYFHCTRITAQTQMKNYKHKKNKRTYIKYCSSTKRHKITKEFKPTLIEQDFNHYAKVIDCHWQSDTLLTQIHIPQRHIKPKVIRALVKACKQKLRLDIVYRSVSTPENITKNDGRIISPHSFVFDGQRFHVRAFCEKRHKFLDFVLSRFEDEYLEFEGAAEHTQSEDEDWFKEVSFTLIPNPKLKPEQQNAVAKDYGMQKHQIKLSSKAALLGYLLQRLRLDTDFKKPEAQQMVLTPDSLNKVSPYFIR